MLNYFIKYYKNNIKFLIIKLSWKIKMYTFKSKMILDIIKLNCIEDEYNFSMFNTVVIDYPHIRYVAESLYFMVYVASQ